MTVMHVIDESDPVMRRARRLRALLDLGGTLENAGGSLHVRGLRMDVRWIAEMDEAVWAEMLREVERTARPMMKADGPLNARR